MIALLAHRSRPASKSSRGLEYRLNRWAHLVRCLGWVRGNFFPRNGCTMDMVARFLERLGRVWITRGPASAISWCKEGRETLLNLLAHPDAPGADRRRSRLVRVFGLPKEVLNLHKVSVIHLRLYLTALVILRGESLPLSVDLTSITGPPSIEEGALDKLRVHLGSF